MNPNTLPFLRNLFFTSCFFFCIEKTQAKTPPCDSVMVSQTGIPKLRYPEKQLNEYRKQDTYQYGQDMVVILSPWQRFKAWFWDKIGRFIFSTTGSSYWQWLTYAFIGAMAFFALLKILGVEASFLFKPKNRELVLNYDKVSENIHEIDFSLLIQEAIENQNYRLAVRLLYLKTLKGLSDAGLINWQVTKTNRTYLYEIKNLEKRERFEALTQQFEYVWYGDFLPNQEQFDDIYSSFKRFSI